MRLISVADPEGVQVVRSNPPLELNYSIFMGNLKKNKAKIGKRTPLSEFEPPIQKSCIRSWILVFPLATFTMAPRHALFL